MQHSIQIYGFWSYIYAPNHCESIAICSAKVHSEQCSKQHGLALHNLSFLNSLLSEDLAKVWMSNIDLCSRILILNREWTKERNVDISCWTMFHICVQILDLLLHPLGHCGLTTSRVVKTNLIRLATTDGSSAWPATAICSSWRVFTGSHAIPLTKYAFAMIAQKPFHWTIISSETGDVDDHRTIVGWGVHRMVMNIMLNHIIHSSTSSDKILDFRLVLPPYASIASISTPDSFKENSSFLNPSSVHPKAYAFTPALMNSSSALKKILVSPEQADGYISRGAIFIFRWSSILWPAQQSIWSGMLREFISFQLTQPIPRERTTADSFSGRTHKGSRTKITNQRIDIFTLTRNGFMQHTSIQKWLTAANGL